MRTKFVVRVLDSAGHLLGWAETMALAKGDGAIWITDPVVVGIERDGTAESISLHWVDVNVEIRQAAPVRPSVFIGEVVTLRWDTDPVYVVGPAAGGLPPVTVRRSVIVQPPVGALGAVAG